MVTKRNSHGTWVLVLFLGAFVTLGGVKEAAGLDVSVNLNLGAPQAVIMGPGSVSFVSNPGLDVFFYSGYWWAMRDNHWYRSHDYNGDWREMDRRYVPRPVYHVYGVPNYRDVYGKHEGKHVPYGQWKKEGHGKKGNGGGKHKHGH